MHLKTLALAAVLSLLAVAFAPASATETKPQDARAAWTPHAVEQLRSVSAVSMSPDGKHVAYTLTVPRVAGKDEDGVPWSELHVLDTADGRQRAFVTGKSSVGRIAWTSDGRSIAYLAKRDGDKETALYTIRIDGGESKKLVGLDTSISAFSFSGDGSQVALLAPQPVSKARKEREDKGFKPQVYEEDGAFARVWIASTREGADKPRQLEVDGHVHQVAWSPKDDRLALAVAPTPLVDDEYMQQRVRVVDVRDGTVLQKIENPGKLGAIAWSPDARWIGTICAADVHDPAAGRFQLWNSGLDANLPLSIEGFPYGEADCTAFAFQDANTAMLVVHRGTEASFEKQPFWGAKMQPDQIIGQLPEGKVIVPTGTAILTSVSLSRDGQHAAFVAHTPEHPPELYTMSHGDSAPKRRTTTNASLEDMPFGKQEIVRWKARDGLDLEGVLVRPIGEQPGRRYPLILSVHGGPEAHESNGWATNYSRPGQIAAARGFAVFYPNYRGSTGRGVAFSKLGQGDAAGKEFDDLVDAVDSLVASGLVDKAKVGITGGSYGGYATAWCSTRYSDRFAAGVMFVGISDKVSKLGTTDIPDEEYYVHALKRPWEAWDFFRERSPIAYAEQCRTPLIILHGKDDPRVDPGQSRGMYRHLKLRGQAPVRLVLYPGEGHGNRKSASRLDYALRMLQWFEHYLQGPGGEPPAYEIDYAPAGGAGAQSAPD